jgi:hypothetical protein
MMHNIARQNPRKPGAIIEVRKEIGFEWQQMEEITEIDSGIEISYARIDPIGVSSHKSKWKR